MKKKKIYGVKFEATCYEEGKRRWVETEMSTKGHLSRFELIGLFELKKAELVKQVVLKLKKE